MTSIEELITEVEGLLKETEGLIEKYPDKFSLRFSKRIWDTRLAELNKLAVLKCPYCHHALESHVQASDSIADGSKCTVKGCNCEVKPKAVILNYSS